MKMKSVTIGLIFFAVCTQISNSMGAIINADGEPIFELLILHNNDMHARFEQTSQLSSTCNDVDKEAGKCYGGFARVANRIRDARSKAAKGEGPPVLYLNAGDTYTGTVWFAVYKWKIAADFINLLQPDAVSLGNHELDEGVGGLSPFIKNLKCPVLAANVGVKNEPELLNEPNLKNSIILNKNGTLIGVIGYLTPETQYLVSPNHVDYEDEVVAIKREVVELQKKGVKILIALGHSGYETDKRIAKEVEGIDLVIGGHTNTFLWNGEEPDTEKKQGPYPTIVSQNSGKKVLVVQAYAYTKYLGRLNLKFNNNGDMISHSGDPILLDNSIPQDEDVLKVLEGYRPGVAGKIRSVVGRTKVLLDGDGFSCRVAECNLGNLITDGLVYTNALDYNGVDGWTNTPIAFMQSGGIRSSVDSAKVDGNITRGDLITVLPFDNAITTVNITGKILKNVLEWSVYNYDPVNIPGAFLQYSGIRVEYNISRPPGSRVVYASARCGACSIPKYYKISDDQYYNILIPQFLFSGGDGYLMLRDNVTSSSILNFNDVNSLEQYIAQKSPIYPEVDGRIKLYGTVQENGASMITVSSLFKYLTISYIASYSSRLYTV